ncbi:MAG: prolyl oligopeptidase family serine peptidase [Clostridia bacterium]|nr:prolyl oligopeptidase family serine peptidase [Clostridia bacterium]MBQ8566785.1 prolyl oligopeptidase family serine peptidase [Clostridia bacterium]
MDIIAKYKCDGYTQVEFEFKGKKSIVLLPEDSRKNGKTIFKTEYFGAFPDLQLEFVRRGYTMIFISNRNRWGTEGELADQYEFVNFCAKEFDISNKVITIGMSCGGMMSVLLAAKYPDCIEALYIDAPVMNFLSCPANFGNAPDVLDSMWTEFENAWGMTKRELLLFRGHPIDMIPILVKNKVKIYMAYGDSDKTVPYEENGIALERAYKEAGLSDLLYIDKKVGVDHHPHGPTDIDFAIKYFED